MRNFAQMADSAAETQYIMAMRKGECMQTEQLSPRKKKLYFRSCHRGIKEMDIIFSQFAEAVLPDLAESELDAYERLLELPDTDLFNWATGRLEVPKEQRFDLLDRMMRLDFLKTSIA